VPVFVNCSIDSAIPSDTLHKRFTMITGMNKQLFRPTGSAAQTLATARLHVIHHRLRRRIRTLWILPLLLLTLPPAVQAEDYTYTTNNGAITIGHLHPRQ
jgi:hypothetical protein